MALFRSITSFQNALSKRMFRTFIREQSKSMVRPRRNEMVRINVLGRRFLLAALVATAIAVLNALFVRVPWVEATTDVFANVTSVAHSTLPCLLASILTIFSESTGLCFSNTRGFCKISSHRDTSLIIPVCNQWVWDSAHHRPKSSISFVTIKCTSGGAKVALGGSYFDLPTVTRSLTHGLLCQ